MPRSLMREKQILIIGATGAVGQAATQIACWRKARVLAAGRSSNPVSGATAVINTTTEDLRERVFELTDNKGADAVFDTVGGAMFEPALRCLRVGGRQIAITSTGERRVCFDLIDFYHNLSRLVGVDTMKLTPRDVAAIAQKLCSGFEAGALKPPAVESVPFENAIQAYERLVTRKTNTKQVLKFSTDQRN
jgi:NADPH:quinone reductase-like Zn-dependent oxidoreductase